jgi:diguanylate cyclase (GGDEF)-like protein
MSTETLGTSLDELLILGKTTSVLYVEDDPMIQQEFSQFLKRFFTLVDLASNGLEGINALCTRSYDLIITDIEMPYMGGLEMIERIKAQNPAQATLIISAYQEISMFQRSIEMGVDGYLFKPIRPHQTIEQLYKIACRIATEKENLLHKNHLEELIETKNQELLHLYATDRISGLYTLGKFEQDLQERKHVSLALFKINDFKSLNDFYGYDVGNSIIRQCADFLRFSVSTLEQSDLYRISGTHFALLSPLDSYDLERFARLTLHLFEESKITVDSETMHLQMSVAIVDRDEEISLSKADIALRESQHTGKVVVYKEDLDKEKLRERRLRCKEEIKRALKEGRFAPYYQPIIDNTTRRIVKYEALARLIMNDGEVISPIHFLSVAKETKTYPQVSQMVIRKAMEDFRDSECQVSINLSIDDIKNAQTRTFLFDQIEAFSEPQRLVFELLESEGIESYDELAVFFNRLKRYGCKIAIDDFGSGYSNFEHLAKLNIDYIKIDGSLIVDIESATLSQTIVEMVTSFAEKINVKTVAEFVGSDSIDSMIVAMGVHESQGYLFGQPIPYDPSMRFVRPLG